MHTRPRTSLSDPCRPVPSQSRHDAPRHPAHPTVADALRRARQPADAPPAQTRHHRPTCSTPTPTPQRPRSAPRTQLVNSSEQPSADDPWLLLARAWRFELCSTDLHSPPEKMLGIKGSLSHRATAPLQPARHPRTRTAPPGLATSHPTASCLPLKSRRAIDTRPMTTRLLCVHLLPIPVAQLHTQQPSGLRSQPAGREPGPTLNKPAHKSFQRCCSCWLLGMRPRQSGPSLSTLRTPHRLVGPRPVFSVSRPWNSKVRRTPWRLLPARTRIALCAHGTPRSSVRKCDGTHRLATAAIIRGGCCSCESAAAVLVAHLHEFRIYSLARVSLRSASEVFPAQTSSKRLSRCLFRATLDSSGLPSECCALRALRDMSSVYL